MFLKQPLKSYLIKAELFISRVRLQRSWECLGETDRQELPGRQHLLARRSKDRGRSRIRRSEKSGAEALTHFCCQTFLPPGQPLTHRPLAGLPRPPQISLAPTPWASHRPLSLAVRLVRAYHTDFPPSPFTVLS